MSATDGAAIELDLLDKHEFQLIGVSLDGANLRSIGDAVADALEVDRGVVLVTDVLESVVTLDILQRSVWAHQLLGRSEAVLQAVGRLPGVSVAKEAGVQARGILGWIGADADDAADALAEGAQQFAEIVARIARRAVIFSTGAEIVGGEVEDTNRVTLTNGLSAAGFDVSFGGKLPDDQDLIAGTLRRAVGQGFGLVVTTGGVGAEPKDCTVEAVLSLDPRATTPYLARFEQGHGRHAKDGIRMAVGTHDGSVIVALPGPNEEVELALPVLTAGLASGTPPHDLATAIADVLRERLRALAGTNDHGART